MITLDRGVTLDIVITLDIGVTLYREVTLDIGFTLYIVLTLDIGVTLYSVYLYINNDSIMYLITPLPCDDLNFYFKM